MFYILSLRDVKVSVNGKEIVKGVNMKIKKGEKHVLLGPNASGKSTLAKAIAGVGEYKISGSIKFLGVEIKRKAPENRAKMGLVLAFQHPPVLRNITLKELLDFIGVKPFFKVDFLERKLNVGFSGGERKTAELLQVLSMDPKLAILDEIDSGIDVRKVRKMGRLIRKWFSDEKGLLLITHSGRIMKEVKPDVVHVMIDGKIICSSRKWRKVWKTVERYGYEKCKKCELSSGR